MVSRVTYRPFEEEDFEELAAILQQTWHNEGPSPEYGFLEACNDLSYSLSISTFSQVALVDDKPCGIVLACPDPSRPRSNKRWFTISKDYFRRMRELEPEAAAAYWHGVQLTESKNDSLLAKSGYAGSTEITLLVVSSSARGMGIGSVLVDAPHRTWCQPRLPLHRHRLHLAVLRAPRLQARGHLPQHAR